MYKLVKHHHSGGITIFYFLMDLFIEMGPPMFEK